MNIRELARIAGVSKSTAAYAMRNNPCVSESQRKRIQALAEKHGYQPNPLVKAYMNEVRKGNAVQGRSCSLCYLSGFIEAKGIPRHEEHRFEQEIIVGAQLEAQDLGYPFEVLSWNPNEMNARRLGQIIKARGIRGILIGPRGTGSEELDFDWENLAGVAYGRSIHKPDFNRIAANLLQAVFDFAERAFRYHHKTIIFALTEATEKRVGHQWLSGATALQAIHGSQKVRVIYDDYQSVVRQLPDICKNAKFPVVMGASSLMDALNENGYAIPRDVGFVANDNERIDAVASIRQPNHEIGRLAVDHLSMLVECARYGSPDIPSLQMIPCGWSEGKTFSQRKK